MDKYYLCNFRIYRYVVSLSGLLPEDSSIQHRIFISIGIIVRLWLILFVAFSGYVFWKRRIELFEASNGYHVYVKCPDTVKYIGTHVAMCTYREGQYYWDYQTVKKALD